MGSGMRALRFEGSERGTLLSRSAPAPSPAPGEALIRPIRVGIAFADLETARGAMGETPITLGHEFVGVIEKAAPLPGQEARAKSLAGQRIVGSPSTACSECDLCRRGLSPHCRKRTVLGVLARDGCFADLFTLPLMNLAPVPKEVDDDRALFAVPVAAALHAAQQLRLEGKPYITILGDGVMGLLCAQVMLRFNASVRIIGRHESKMELAGKWGIKSRHESEVGRRADQDVVVDCTGSPSGLELAMKLVRPRGKILVKGALAAGAGGAGMKAVDLSPIAANEIEIIGSRCGPVSEALELLRREEVDVLSLISRRMRLDEGPEAMRTARKAETVKVVLDI